MREELIKVGRVEEGTTLTLGLPEAIKLLLAGKIVRPTFWRGTEVALRRVGDRIVKIYGSSDADGMSLRITSVAVSDLRYFELEGDLLDIVRHRAWGIEVDSPEVAQAVMQDWEEISLEDLDEEHAAEQAALVALRGVCLRCGKKGVEERLKLATDGGEGLRQSCLDCRIELGDLEAVREKARMKFHV